MLLLLFLQKIRRSVESVLLNLSKNLVGFHKTNVFSLVDLYVLDEFAPMKQLRSSRPLLFRMCFCSPGYVFMAFIDHSAGFRKRDVFPLGRVCSSLELLITKLCLSNRFPFLRVNLLQLANIFCTSRHPPYSSIHWFAKEKDLLVRSGLYIFRTLHHRTIPIKQPSFFQFSVFPLISVCPLLDIFLNDQFVGFLASNVFP